MAHTDYQRTQEPRHLLYAYGELRSEDTQYACDSLLLSLGYRACAKSCILYHMDLVRLLPSLYLSASVGLVLRREASSGVPQPNDEKLLVFIDSALRSYDRVSVIYLLVLRSRDPISYGML